MKLLNQTNSLYLHVPVCKHLCNFCDFYKVKSSVAGNEFDQFESHVNASIAQAIELHDKHEVPIGKLETVYLGGGTPSLWSSRGADYFNKNILNQFKLAQRYEMSFEVDPSAWYKVGLNAWLQLGVNRFSLGIQSTQDDILTLIDRGHSRKDVFDLLDFVSKQGVNFSCDFMLGLPKGKNHRNIELELAEILKYSPNHISLYIYSVTEKHPLFDQIIEDDLVAHEFILVHEILEQAGFCHYEVSNYAKPGFESRHNWKYWTHQNMAALGPSASGYFQHGNAGTRYKWQTQQPVMNIEKLNTEQVMLERTYTEFRTRLGLEYKKYFNNLTEVEKLIKFWSDENWTTVKDERIVLTPRGMVVMDSIHNMLLRHL